MIVEGLFEFAHDAITFLRRGIDRHQIVVVQVDAVRAEPAQFFDDLNRAQTWPRGLAKWIASAIADGP